MQQERKLKKRAENLQEEVKPEPIEVDEVLGEKKLKDLENIKGLRLSPQAFANMLHIYEFLHTFGNTLGFDMDSLPALSSLQKALLHIDENEEELLSVLSHLLVCAVEGKPCLIVKYKLNPTLVFILHLLKLLRSRSWNAKPK